VKITSVCNDLGRLLAAEQTIAQLNLLAGGSNILWGSFVGIVFFQYLTEFFNRTEEWCRVSTIESHNYKMSKQSISEQFLLKKHSFELQR
jgi:hypothetical protein